MMIPLWRRYARLLGPDPVADVRDELRFHLEAKTDDLIAQGLSPDAAREEAQRQLGDVQTLEKIGTRIGEKIERLKRLQEYWNDLLRDLRYSLRTLARNPGFAVVCTVILSLAIAANIVVFSVVNTLLLRPLPIPHSHQLVWISPRPSGCGLSCATYSADAFEEFREQSRTYQDVTGYFAFSTAYNLRTTGLPEPQPATGIDVIGNFFQVLGVRPAMGRIFTADELRGVGTWSPY